MKRYLPILLMACGLVPLFGQSMTAITATGLPTGANQMCFLGTDANNNPVTYTPSGGSTISGPVCFSVASGTLASATVANTATASPAGLTYRVTIINGNTVYLAIPGVVISGTSWPFNSFGLASNMSAVGIGLPTIACSYGAAYTATNLPDGQNGYFCGPTGQWQGQPTTPYCPVGQAYLVPTATGKPSCIPPSTENLGPPTGKCIEKARYTQADGGTSPEWDCVNQAWVHTGAITNANAWAINLTGQILYGEGPSTLRAYHSGGTYVCTTALPQGGCSGNFLDQFMQLPWASGHFSAYANDATDGSTSTAGNARWSTGGGGGGGSSVVVPSAQTFFTQSASRKFFLIDMGMSYNDQNASISLGTSTANYTSMVTNAHNAGAIVIMLTTPLRVPGNAAANGNIEVLNQTAYYRGFGLLPTDMVGRMDKWLSDIYDINFFDSADHIHPAQPGDVKIAIDLNSFMIGQGAPGNYYDYFTDPAFAVSGLHITHDQNATCLPGASAFSINCPLGATGTFADDEQIFADADTLTGWGLMRSGTANGQGIFMGVTQATNHSSIQSVQSNVGPTPLDINLQGGAVNTKNAILDDGAGNTLVNSIRLSGTATLHGVDSLSATDTVRTPVPASQCVDYNVTVTGAIAGAILSDVRPSVSLGNLALNTYTTSGGGAVTFHYCNPTAAAITPPSATFAWLQIR